MVRKCINFRLHFNSILGQHSPWQKKEQHEQKRLHRTKTKQSNQVHSVKNTSRLIILLSSWCGTITVECFSWWEELWILTSYQLEILFRTNLLSSEESCNCHGNYLFYICIDGFPLTLNPLHECPLAHGTQENCIHNIYILKYIYNFKRHWNPLVCIRNMYDLNIL